MPPGSGGSDGKHLERPTMTSIQSERLDVRLGASLVRRRLKGREFGVRKVASVGRGEAVIFPTATGQHLRELRALFQDVLAESGETADEPAADADRSGESGQPS